MTNNFPKFGLPPVIETVIGVSFNNLASWQIPHFGLFWETVRDEYDQFSVQPPLPDEFEVPAGSPPAPIMIDFGRPQQRCWFFNEKLGWLLQVQQTRFLSNWRHVPGASYPNYSNFIKRFSNGWDRFQDFLAKEKIEQPQLLKAEVSYVNHIDFEVNYERIRDTFPALSGFKKGEFLDMPIGFALNTVYAIADQQGRLHISGQPVIRHTDMREVIQLSVTAKTQIASNTPEAMREAIDLGHEWVVRGFTDFTSPEMHALWKRTQ
jgi:uncharacterized protein (TIGR04255 family)